MYRICIGLLICISIVQVEMKITPKGQKKCGTTDAWIEWNVYEPTIEELSKDGAAYNTTLYQCKTNVSVELVQWRIKEKPQDSTHKIIWACKNVSSGVWCPLQNISLETSGELSCKVINGGDSPFNCLSKTLAVLNQNSTIKFSQNESENGKVIAGQSVRIPTLTSSTSTVTSTTVSTSTSTVISATTRISSSTVSSTIMPTSTSEVNNTTVPTSTVTVSRATRPTIASTVISPTVLTTTSTVSRTTALTSASTLGTLSKNLTKQYLNPSENGSSLQMSPGSTKPPALYVGAGIGAFVACSAIATAVACWLKRRRRSENSHSEPPAHQREEAVYSIVLNKKERLRNGAAGTQDSQEYGVPPNDIYANFDELPNGITSNGVHGVMESCASYENIYGDTGPSEYTEYAVPQPELYGNILTGVADDNLYGNMI